MHTRGNRKARDVNEEFREESDKGAKIECARANVSPFENGCKKIEEKRRRRRRKGQVCSHSFKTPYSGVKDISLARALSRITKPGYTHALSVACGFGAFVRCCLLILAPLCLVCFVQTLLLFFA